MCPFSRHLHRHLRQGGEGSGAAGERREEGDAPSAENHPHGRLQCRSGGAGPRLRRPRPGPAGGGGMTLGETSVAPAHT